MLHPALAGNMSLEKLEVNKSSKINNLELFKTNWRIAFHYFAEKR
jgi:hypothetical protein